MKSFSFLSFALKAIGSSPTRLVGGGDGDGGSKVRARLALVVV